jgi:cation:H+ antiporter
LRTATQPLDIVHAPTQLWARQEVVWMDGSVLLWFAAGLLLLVVGADWLVKGASQLATAAGVSPLVTGLTVVAFGTSAPEMAVSVKAAWLGQPEMAVGNAVGSNIFNVLVILGLSALITPLVVARDIVRRDIPVMLAMSGLLLLLLSDGSVSRTNGMMMLLGLALYSVWIVQLSRRELRNSDRAPDTIATTASATGSTVGKSVTWVALGLLLLVLGSQWLVDSAVSFARWAGISEVVVSLTIVAAGTSLPELATSVLAAMRGHRDIAIGNVVGSNLFNIMGVVGLSGAVAPAGLPVAAAMIEFDIPFMIATAFACLPMFARGRRIPRWQGGMFLLAYAAYVTYLLLDATQHEAKAGYVAAMLGFVIPLLLLTLLVLAIHIWRPRRTSAG